MDSAVLSNFYLLRKTFSFVDTNDLFNVCEVCRAWQAAGISVLREKLRYIFFYHLKSKGSCRIAENGQPMFLEEFCRDLRRFIRTARLAGHSPTFGFLSYSSSPTDEKAVVQQIQRELPPKCVVVYRRSKTITMHRKEEPTRACSVHKGITGAFLFGPSARSPAPALDPVATKDPSLSTAREDDARTLPLYRAQCNFRRSPLEKLSKLFQRAVLRRPVEAPCLRNVAPGVMLFQSMLIPPADGLCLYTEWKEEYTGRSVAVSFMRLFQQHNAAFVSQLLQEFRNEFGARQLRDMFVIVLQDSMESTLELNQIMELFRGVPVISTSGKFLRKKELEALQGCQPLYERRVIVMALRLLPSGAHEGFETGV